MKEQKKNIVKKINIKIFSKWLIMILTKINEKLVKWILTFLLKNDIDLSFKVKEIRIILDPQCILLSICTRSQIYIFQGNQKNQILYTIINEDLLKVEILN